MLLFSVLYDVIHELCRWQFAFIMSSEYVTPRSWYRHMGHVLAQQIRPQCYYSAMHEQRQHHMGLIQQIGAAYGFDVSSPAFSPLVLSIFNVAAASTRESKNQALREITVAAAAIAQFSDYKGRVAGTFRDQNRHLPREIAKNIGGRKIAQMIPIAGAAIGAGINYWFTTETAETAFMLFRALYIERKERS